MLDSMLDMNSMLAAIALSSSSAISANSSATPLSLLFFRCTLIFASLNSEIHDTGLGAQRKGGGHFRRQINVRGLHIDSHLYSANAGDRRLPRHRGDVLRERHLGTVLAIGGEDRGCGSGIRHVP